jgi:hypothetical protein
MTPGKSKTAQRKAPLSNSPGLVAEETAALDHVQVSAVGDVSESGKVVGVDRPQKKRGR